MKCFEFPVFSGIPGNVPDNNLESTVILVLLHIDVYTSWAKEYWGMSLNWQTNFQNIEDNCKIC